MLTGTAQTNARRPEHTCCSVDKSNEERAPACLVCLVPLQLQPQFWPQAPFGNSQAFRK